MANVEVKCGTCSTPFTVPAYKIRLGKGRYCGKPCYDIAQSRTAADKFWPNVTKTDDCWLYLNRSSSGYGQMKHQGRNIGAHRVSWEIHHGPIPNGSWVLHRCDNPPCVRPEHLFLGTPGDNSRDRNDKGRANHQGYPAHRYVPRGEEVEQSRLAESEIPRIRERFASGESMRSIARSHGVTHEAIRKVIRRETWTHVA